MSNLTEIRPVGTALVPADRKDGRTDMTKLRGASLNFAIVPKNCFLASKDHFV